MPSPIPPKPTKFPAQLTSAQRRKSEAAAAAPLCTVPPALSRPQGTVPDRREMSDSEECHQGAEGEDQVGDESHQESER